MQCEKRLTKELNDHVSNPNPSISIMPYNDNIRFLRCAIKPNSDSIYYFDIDGELATYNLDIEVSSEYPFTCPKVIFNPPIYHPNVFAVTGNICLDILKDAWTPAITISSLCISILSLMNAPNTSDPVNAVAAELFENDKEMYKEEVKKWYILKK